MFELMKSISIDPAGLAHGEAVVTPHHPIFADHFPATPMLPGSLLIELAAQVAGPLAEEITKARSGLERWALLGMVRDARFIRPVSLPATLSLNARVSHFEELSISFYVTAYVKNYQVMRAELVMMMVEAQPDWRDAIQARSERLARWKAQA